MSYERKIINDPVFGFINLPKGLLYNLVQHPLLQRLTRIKQLGLSSVVYPGAQHTRFQHSLGAYYLMTEAIQHLTAKGNFIFDSEAEAVKAAILMHDIGHGPFSHVLEDTIVQGISHEDISLMLMERINHEMNGQLTLAIQIFKDEYPKKFLHQLVSGQLDMDRLDYLRRDDVQQRIADETHRRTDATTPDDSRMAFEIPFPNRLATVRALLSSWVSEVRKPANMVFQIDTSGSMGGERLDALKAALLSLTETGADGTAALLTFQPRETIRFVEFASGIKSEKDLVVGEDGNLADVSSYVNDLSALGGTALYGTLQHALELAAQTRADDNVTSVVLFSDGENTDAPGIDGFAQWYEANEAVQGIPVYAILFGEASADEMGRLAELTGGRVFDAVGGDLTSAFKEIRGYL